MAEMTTELIYKANVTVPRTLTGLADAVRCLTDGAREAGVPEAPASTSLYQSNVYQSRPSADEQPLQKVDITVRWTGEQHVAWSVSAPKETHDGR